MKYLSVTSADRATKQLKLIPHLINAVHQLQQGYMAARIQFHHWGRRFVGEGVRFMFDMEHSIQRRFLKSVRYVKSKGQMKIVK
jgi:L-ascorbate metabolism protein UlaG (beta-lactamase superfamily)